MIAIVATISASVILHNYNLFLLVGIIKFYLSASLIIIIVSVFTVLMLVFLHFSRVQLFCDPMDCGSLGSSVHGILQARILE